MVTKIALYTSVYKSMFRLSSASVGRLRIEPWMGQKSIFLHFPLLESEEQIRDVLTKLSRSMTEHMIRLGKNSWCGVLSLRFGNEDLSNYFAKHVPIAFPLVHVFDVSVETTYLVNPIVCRRLIVSNSYDIAMLYDKILSCTCDRNEEECHECDANLKRLDHFIGNKDRGISHPPALVNPWVPFE